MSGSSPMLTDILRQPEVLHGLLARRAAFCELGRAHLVPGPGGRVFAFGCGDGWFAARAVAAIAGRFVQPATSLEMVLGGGFSHADRAVAISLSGSVDRTNAAAGRVVQEGGVCLALTHEHGGALGRIAGQVAPLRVPEVAQFLTGTTRYSATVLGLMMLLEGAQGGCATASAQMQAFVEEQLPSILTQSLAVCRDVCPGLAPGISGIRLLGGGAEWATADYGAAKMVKIVDLPCWSGEIEEFAHSQFWGARRQDLVVLLAGGARQAALAENTAQALAACGMACLAVETAGVAVPSAHIRLSLPAVPAFLAPLAVAAPLQLLAYFMSLATGGAPDMPGDQGDPSRFRTAQLLSRTSELAPAA